jgi:hypothetical protein
VAQEGISNEEEIGVLAWKFALMNYKVAFAFVCGVEVLRRIDFKNVVAHLEAHWLDFFCDQAAALWNLTKSGVGCAVEVFKRLGPFVLDFIEHVWRD